MFPKVTELLPELMPFIHEVAAEYASGQIDTLEAYIDRIHRWWTPERIAATDRVIPGWQAMATYPVGGNLAHVTAVLVALVLLPEYAALSPDERAISQWVVIFHDISKRRDPNARDHVHPFRSAAAAGVALAGLGFPLYADPAALDRWARHTADALTLNTKREAIPDNTQLPTITAGIRELFGWDTPAGLIVRTVLHHQSFTNVEEDPPATELTPDEMRRYFDLTLFPVLRVMMLVDCDGWALFDLDEKAMWRESTLNVFASIARLLA